MSWHRGFAATNAPGTCKWCGRKLRQKYHTTWKYARLLEPKGPCGKQIFTISGPITCTSTEYVYDYSKTGRKFHACGAGHRHGPVERKIVDTREKLFDKPGDYGDGQFCGLRCGYLFGVEMARDGRVLTLKKKGRAV